MAEKSERKETGFKSNPIEAGKSGLIVVKDPKPPEGMSGEEIEKFKNQAEKIVSRLGETTGSKELEILDSMANMGIQAQRNAASYLDLLKARVGVFLDEGGPSQDIANSLRDLRLTLEQINPNDMNGSGWSRFFHLFPFSGKHNPIRILQRIALRYEPVSHQVAIIETRLHDGRALLVRDNVELRKLYEQIETQQPIIAQNAYLGELLMQRLDLLLKQTTDPIKRDRIQGAIHDVAMRVQDLRTMEEVHIQYFVSIEMSRRNNNRLGQAIERTLTLSTNVVTAGLAIQAALIRQRKVMEATRRTREFLGNVVATNAAAIKRHTEEIGDLYSNPVIAIEKITQAHNDLVEALDIADHLRQEGIQTAKDSIVKLTQMSTNLTQRAAGLLEKRNIESGSVANNITNSGTLLGVPDDKEGGSL